MSVCPICDDSGWKPLPNGRVARCDCRTAAQTERLLKLAHIPKRYEHCELSNYQIDFDGKHHTSLSRARFFCQTFVHEYPVHKDGLLLVGAPGIGKTHLAVGIMHELIRSKAVPCLFCDYRELLKEIQNSYNPEAQTTEMELLRPIQTAEVLVLDDLGAAKPSEWVWDTVTLILNTRYSQKLTTVITTNYDDLPERDSGGTDDPRSRQAAQRAASKPTLGDRITNRMRSRLHEMCRKIEMQGEDYRPKVKSSGAHAR